MRFIPRALAMLGAAALAVSVTPAWPAAAGTAPESRPKSVPANAVAVKVKKVLDGDTVDVTVKGGTARVRLLDVDAPDKGQCWFEDTWARTSALLPAGKTAYFLRDKESRDADGRYLLYAWSATGVFVNGNLARYGYAQAEVSLPEHRYTALLLGQQAAARAEGRGMWSGLCWAADTYDKRGTTEIPGAVSLLTPQPVPSLDLGRNLTPAPSPSPSSSASPSPSPSPEETDLGADPNTEPGMDPSTDPPADPGTEWGTDLSTDPETDPATDPSPSATPSPSPTAGDGVDPRFPTCAEANRHGYGNYKKGVDVEYGWYFDRDHDGIVCEF
ncbi:thermonuclease family protein [Planotetraspora sp. A-T 1434]|uniref:thermonuclease family protein n=1 Tax=Planotetraspora sp. A-T 1434 TaxID=2979219 RepID=UPI0021BF9B72|nr:excalibur calcium-binding domain-containing protein [Planotetraspora sp. A-T 1434]MCT9931692.1 thermonuclease family protein [Planotetraspora sp. A-T 1434]